MNIIAKAMGVAVLFAADAVNRHRDHITLPWDDYRALRRDAARGMARSGWAHIEGMTAGVARERAAVVARLREFEAGCRENCLHTPYSAEVWDLAADGVAELADEIRDGEHVREVSGG